MARLGRMIVWVRMFFVALALAGAGGVFAHGVTLDAYSPEAEQSAFHREFLVPWIEKVEKQAGGRVHMHLHPATGGDVYAQLSDGGYDIAWTPIAPSAERFATLAKLPAPDLSGGLEAASRALWESARMNDVLDRDFDGVHVFALHYGVPAEAGGKPRVFVFGMSSGAWRGLSDELKAVFDANGGPETCAWLAKVMGKAEK